MAETLVMTNLATGQAWSHFTGYCNVVFPREFSMGIFD